MSALPKSGNIAGPAKEICAGDNKTRKGNPGLILGLGVFGLMLALPVPSGLEPAAWRVAATAVLMAIWWVSEALPVAATALLPLALFPLLDIAPIKAVAAPYANPLIFLFLGGFIIALAIERWNLHRRVALWVLASIGAREDQQIAGFMLATAFLSMWVSNTATTIMMLPVALSIVPRSTDGEIDPAKRDFATALLLSIAYSASIGGLATLIGTPPNALLAGFMSETYGVTIGFAQWMLVGLPLASILLILCWCLLTRVLFRIGRDDNPEATAEVGAALKAMGRLSRPEKLVALVFLSAAGLWVARPFMSSLFPDLALTDTGIAIICALALFVIPANAERGEYLMDWESAERLPWGVLLLFGGGLSLAAAVASTGLATWLGGGLSSLASWPIIGLVLAVTCLMITLTEMTSNTATTAAFLPLVGALAVSIGLDPLLLTIPAALAASCAFMMPVATVPNAIVFGSGHIGIAQMARAGLWLNLVGIVAITAIGHLLVARVFVL